MMKRTIIVCVLLTGCREKKPVILEGEPAVTASASAVASAAPTPRPTPRPLFKDVELKKLLSEYDDNEVRADAAFKDKVIRTSGKVGEVKKDILGDIYVTIGTGKDFEIPQVQCFVSKDSEADAASLSKGKIITVAGKVSGLMMNVLVKECVINPMMRICEKLRSEIGGKKCITDSSTGDSHGMVITEVDKSNEVLGLLLCTEMPPDKYESFELSDIKDKEGRTKDLIKAASATCLMSINEYGSSSLSPDTRQKIQAHLNGL